MIGFDVSKFPLVVITYLPGTREHDMRFLNTEIERLLLIKKQRFVLLSDMTQQAIMNDLGKITGEFIERRRDDLRKYVLGHCIVLSSMPGRAAVRASMLVLRPPFRIELTDSLVTGNKWCRDRLAEDGLGRVA